MSIADKGLESGLRPSSQIHAESKGDDYDLRKCPVIDRADLTGELSWRDRMGRAPDGRAIPRWYGDRRTRQQMRI